MNGARRWMPALLTRMSGVPHACSISVMPRSTAAWSVTSNVLTRVSPPVSSARSWAVAVTWSRLRPWMVTRLPGLQQTLGQGQPDPAAGSGDECGRTDQVEGIHRGQRS